MLPKLSSDAYDYRIFDATKNKTDGVEIILCQTATGKSKRFFCAGHTYPALHLLSHMNSLTDDLCSSWFNERPAKKKKEKNETAESN